LLIKVSFHILILCLLLSGCKNPEQASSKTADTPAKMDSLPYHFVAKYSLNWQPGDPHNALLVLNCLKK